MAAMQLSSSVFRCFLQTQVKVGQIANVAVAPDGSTKVQAPGTDVIVQPKTGVKGE